MAIVYFTSTASTGAGSLSEAIANATVGDVIRPDETVFERGSTLEIALTAALTVDKNLTFDGGPFRVRVNGGGALQCCNVATGVNVEFAAFDFVGGASSQNGGGLNVATGANVVLSRCRVCGCDATGNGGGVYVDDGASLFVEDTAIYGCRASGTGGGVYVADGAAIHLSGATAAGNVSAAELDDVDLNGSESATIANSIVAALNVDLNDVASSGSVVDVALSSVGFADPPPNDLTSENWSAIAWQSWNLRLLDDASSSPSPYRDAGEVNLLTLYDLDGNFRGRAVGDVTTCSPGAYETIQADLFWVGVDSSGAAVESPSLLNADGWATSRFATASGDSAPQAEQSVFIDGSAEFIGAALALGKLTIGGGASLVFNVATAKTLTLRTFDFGVGSTTTNSDAIQRFQSRSSATVGRIGDFASFNTQFYFGAAPSLEIAPTAYIATAISTVRLYGAGIYNNYNLQINGDATIDDGAFGANNIYVTFTTAAGRVVAANSPRVTCNVFSWATYAVGASGLADGSAPVVVAPRKSCKATGAAGDLIVDVSESDDALTLTLTGQTIYGDASTAALTLIGAATVGENDLTSQSLTLTDGAALTIDGGRVSVVDLTLGDASSLIFTAGANVVLTTVSVAAAMATGDGAFFAPTAAPAGLTLENGAIWGDASAGVTSLDVDPVNATTVKFTVVKTTADAPLVAQFSDDDGATWRTVETTPDAVEYDLTVVQGADVSVRVATASGWLTETVSTAPFIPVWTVSGASERVVGVLNAFEIATGGSNDGVNSYDFNDYGYL